MQTALWLAFDNPFLVKAFRARQHSGWIYFVPVAFVVLGILQVAVAFQLAYMSANPARVLGNYMQTCDAFLITQLLAAVAFISLTSVSNGMAQEVRSGTIEFQRLTSLTSFQIVTGKAIGEPILAYLVTFASVPVLVVTSILGGYDLIVKLHAWIACFTTTFAMASLGTIVPNRTRSNYGSSRIGPAASILGLSWFLLPLALSTGAQGVAGLVLGWMLPLPYLAEVWTGDFGSRQVHLFHRWPVKLVWLTPWTQVLTGLLLLLISARLLKGESVPPVSRWMGYVLFVISAAASLAVVGSAPAMAAMPAYGRALQISLSGFFALLFFLLSTPDRSAYYRWIWRDRERYRGWTAYLFADTSPPWCSLVVYALSYVAFLVVAAMLSPAGGTQISRHYAVVAAVGWSTFLSLAIAGHALAITLRRYGRTMVFFYDAVMLLLWLAIEIGPDGVMSDDPKDWGPAAGLSAWVYLPLLLTLLSSSGTIDWGQMAAFVGSRVVAVVIGVALYLRTSRSLWRKVLKTKEEMGVGMGCNGH